MGAGKNDGFPEGYAIDDDVEKAADARPEEADGQRKEPRKGGGDLGVLELHLGLADCKRAEQATFMRDAPANHE